MELSIKRILNKPIDSNSFVIYSQQNSSCIIVDPGTEDCFNLIKFIEERNLKPEYIFLTHEHFDHIWGVRKLKELYDAKIVCSTDCALRIIDKKKNMSVFYNQVGFETFNANITIEEIGHRLIWNSNLIQFINAPGHTQASICISIRDVLFTGDTIIKSLKTIVKLPSDNKQLLVRSLEKIFSRFDKKSILAYPGHGEIFKLNTTSINEFI